MTVKLYNSPFEMELRILLLLSVNSKALYTVDRIVALDFISCYARDFNLPYCNLHGHNNYKYGEISNRRLLVQEAIKKLVTKGLIKVVVNRGYLFSISNRGEKYNDKLKSSYAKKYRIITEASIKKFEKESDERVLAEIQSCSVESLKE